MRPSELGIARQAPDIHPAIKVPAYPDAQIPWRGQRTECRQPITIIVDQRALTRECLARVIREQHADERVLAYDSIEDWLATEPVAAEIVLVILAGSGRTPAELKRDWTAIMASGLGRSVPLVLLADEKDANYVMEAIDDGVRGYISLDVPLRVALEAIELVRAGGIYVPASSFRPGGSSRNAGGGAADFTGRQAEVARALRRGTSNKIIAHELNMAESTVKVHVRNIMRKLKALNRTHVAFLLNEREKARW